MGQTIHAEGAERILQRLELGVEKWIDALAGLVAGPERVAERLDDAIVGDQALVALLRACPGRGCDDAAHRPELRRNVVARCCEQK